tara:strand:+ start:67 stop:471 length:405 start_codon:yes stop_codon:yes gene_type:complete
MARGTYEQAPVQKQKTNEAMRTVVLSKSGDEGVDAGMIEQYEAYGFSHVNTSKTGAITMQSPKSVQEAREAAAIAEHHRRANIKGTTQLPGGARMLEDNLQRINQPLSGSQLMENLELPDLTGHVQSSMDDDEL